MRALEDADLDELQTQAERYGREWEEYCAMRKTLERRYDSRFLVLPPGTADRVENSWKRVGELLSPPSKGDEGLLMRTRELTEFVRGLPDKLVHLKRDTEEVESLLGITGEVQNINRTRRMSDLVRLCDGDQRPERAWMSNKTLQDTKEALEACARAAAEAPFQPLLR